MHLYGDDINKFRVLGVLIYFHEINLMLMLMLSYIFVITPKSLFLSYLRLT